MNIRKATDEDMDKIMDLLNCVFEGEQQIPRELNLIEESKFPQWWCVEKDGEIVGATALFKENNDWHMGRIAISSKLRGQHMGTKLLRTALEDIFAQDINAVYLDARDATVHIMKQFGAEIIGEPISFYEGNVTPIILKKEDFFKHTI